MQCPVWLFSVVPWLHVFLVCCSRIFWMTLKKSQSPLLLLVSSFFIIFIIKITIKIIIIIMFGAIFAHRSMSSSKGQHACLKIRVMPTAFAYSWIALKPIRVVETRCTRNGSPTDWLIVCSHIRRYGTDTKLNSTAVQWLLRYFSFQTKNKKYSWRKTTRFWTNLEHTKRVLGLPWTVLVWISREISCY